MLADLGTPNVSLVQILRGDREAVRLVQAIVRIFHVWDDLIDRDGPVSDDDVHQAFWLALCDIPANPFYRRHLSTFQPLIEMGTLSWWAANEMERSERRAEREVAFSVRSQIAEVTTAAAMLLGGVDWARACGPAIKRLAYLDSLEESLSDYMTEMEKKHGMVQQPEA